MPRYKYTGIHTKSHTGEDDLKTALTLALFGALFTSSGGRCRCKYCRSVIAVVGHGSLVSVDASIGYTLFADVFDRSVASQVSKRRVALLLNG